MATIEACQDQPLWKKVAFQHEWALRKWEVTSQDCHHQQIHPKEIVALASEKPISRPGKLRSEWMTATESSMDIRREVTYLRVKLHKDTATWTIHFNSINLLTLYIVGTFG